VNDLRPEGRGHVGGAVPRPVVDHDRPVSDRHTEQERGQRRGLVEDRDDDVGHEGVLATNALQIAAEMLTIQ
jgi:hypothetical protein